MSVIYDRLVSLNESVIGLEATADAALKKVQDMQNKLQTGKKRGGKNEPDLFSKTSMPANKNAVGPVAYDPKLVASKIDLAIGRIEQIMKEG